MYVLYLEWTIAEKAYSKTVSIDGPKTLGRATEADFAVMDSTVSKRQAQISEGSSGVVMKNLSDTVKIKVGATEFGANESTGIANKMTFSIGTVGFYALVISVSAGTLLNATCSTCHRPIAQNMQVCPWCGSPQQEPEGGWTMAI